MKETYERDLFIGIETYKRKRNTERKNCKSRVCRQTPQWCPCLSSNRVRPTYTPWFGAGYFPGTERILENPSHFERILFQLNAWEMRSLATRAAKQRAASCVQTRGACTREVSKVKALQQMYYCSRCEFKWFTAVHAPLCWSRERRMPSAISIHVYLYAIGVATRYCSDTTSD